MEEHILPRGQAVDGICPHCGSSDYELLEDGPEDDYYFYRMECNNCHTEYTDWYRLEFVEQAYNTSEELEEDRQAGREYRQQYYQEENKKKRAIAMQMLLNSHEYINNRTMQLLIDRLHDEKDVSLYGKYDGAFNLWQWATLLTTYTGYSYDHETGRLKPTNIGSY